MQIKIEIDYREKPSGIFNILKNMDGILVEEKRLPLGDYRINGRIIVERKTTKDFVVSMIDGRLFSQASRLKRFAERPVFVIEGRDIFHTGYDIDPQAIKGAITSLSITWYIPVVFSTDINGTARFLTMAGIQDMTDQTGYGKRYGRKPKRTEKLKLHILQGLPDIGPKTARKMLKRFGSIEKTITAPERELAMVKGIGNRKAAKIREIVE